MIRRLLQRLLTGGSELLVAFGLVAAFALVFLATLMVVFPKGSGLVKLYGDILGQDRPTQPRSGGVEDTGEPEDQVVAVLAEVVRNVKDRPGNAVAWASSRVGTTIDDGHAVQTLAGSGASLIVGKNTQMTMGENSLVIFRREQAGSSSRANRAALVLMGGQLLGTVPVAGGESEAPVDIVAGGATTAVRASGKTPADFAVSVDGKKASTFSLYAGEAEITTGGQKVKLKPNQAVTISASGVAAKPTRIPDPPRPLSPDDGRTETFSTDPPQIDFRWEEAPGAERYRLVIAKDAAFTEIEHEQELSQTRLVHSNLEPGTHHWRVTAIAGHIESKPGPARSIELVQDREPPKIDVNIPSEVVGTNSLVIHGTAEPGSRITIGNRSVSASDSGAFEIALLLNEGLNMIVVEVTDPAGNGSFVSKYVNVRF